MPKASFKGDLMKHKASRQRQNLRTFQNIQERREAHDQAHGLRQGATNASASHFKTAPTAKS